MRHRLLTSTPLLKKCVSPPLPIFCPRLFKQSSSNPSQLRASRSFTTTSQLRKKGKKLSKLSEDNEGSITKHKVNPATAPTSQGVDDPSDFTDLEANILQAHKKLENALSKLRAGGRFNTELLEDIRVVPVKGKPGVRLGDLAQTFPKGGRILVLMVGESEVSIPSSCLFKEAMAAGRHFQDRI